jgi:hypothetical protein
MRFLSSWRLAGPAGMIGITLGVAAGGTASPPLAGATTVSGGGGVSATPTDGTPQLVLTSNRENVRQLVKCGSMMYAVGTFTRIKWNGTIYVRNNVFSFRASKPYTMSGMKVNVNGTVNTIAFTKSHGCADAYLGGAFTSVHGTAANNIAEISTKTGAVVKGFGHNANGEVNTLLGHGGHLLDGGSFTSTNGHARSYYASLNPTTGRDDGFLRLGVHGNVAPQPSKIYNQQLSHSGNRLLVEGNFTSVGGRARQQIFMLNLTGSQAKVTGWHSKEFNNHCQASESFYVRSAAWAPGDATIYVADTGFKPLNWDGTFPLTGLCDASAAFPATAKAVHHEWINYTGCDSLYSVAADSSTVYVAGHPRWSNNANGCNHKGPGAISDPGLQGLRLGGKVKLNTSGTARYTMSRANADDMLITGAGLWIASSNRLGSQQCGGVGGHSGICFLPYR